MIDNSSAHSDRQLAKSAADGSVDAWHRIIDRYSGLIYSLTCRYVKGHDVDDRRNVYVEVLETLHDGALARYDGRATLATWIGVVTRGRCLDHLRRKFGRNGSPPWLGDLAEDDQEIYHLYYVEGYRFDEICAIRSGHGRPCDADEIVQSLDRIDSRLDESSRLRLAFELEARTVFDVSGRLLEYLEFARQESEESIHDYRNDLANLDDDARALMNRLSQALESLDVDERNVIRLRYREGIEAKSVASRLKLKDARKVYTISNRAIRKLKKLLLAEEATQ